MKIVLVVIVLLAIAFAGLAIKVIFTKDRQLEKSCCGKTLNKDASCGCSGQ
ncbi:MAG: hypothetical protein N4A72_07880 [Bacteroidales bacterium]|jgi:hypothetical protein|nr:hypothetical protein [Bacteroidales bacterium]